MYSLHRGVPVLILIFGACIGDVDPTEVLTVRASSTVACPSPSVSHCDVVNSQVVDGWIDDLQALMGTEADPRCQQALNALQNASLDAVYLTGEFAHFQAGLSSLGPGYIVLNENHIGGTLTDFNRDTLIHEALHNAGYDHPDFGGETQMDEFAAGCFDRSPAPWPPV